LEKYDLPGRVHVYFSPVFGAIDPKDMVAFMTEHRLNQVNLQLQLHKFIWDPNEKGV
jgi:7-carboxy-7-deazaguanine synthase